MIRAVVDTNVLISGLIWGGTPKRCFDKFRYENSYQLIFSPELVHEFRTKLLKKFQLPSQKVNLWVKELTQYSEFINPTYVTKICRDPKDNMLLDTAHSGQANFIVTGDKDLLTLKSFKHIEIVSPKSFLNILSKTS